MFYDNYVAVCKKHGKKPTPVAVELGLSSSNVAQWKKGSTPRPQILQKIADYFDVSVGYLLGYEQQEDEKKPTPVSDSSPAGLTELGRIYCTLNSEGQEKLLDYAVDLAASGRYIKTDPA